MNRKQFTLLLVLVIALGGIGLYLYKQNNRSWESAGAAGEAKLLGDFDPNKVATLHIKQASGELTLHKKDDLWRVKERGDYPANFDQISELVRKVWELKPVQKMQIGQSSLGRLELTEPGKGDKSGTLVEFAGGDDKVIQSLLLGKPHMKESPANSQFGGGSWPDGRYVMVGSDLASVSLVTEPFSNVEAKPDQWLNKDFFKVENLSVVSVTSTNAAESWKITRPSATGEWQLADAKPTEKYDATQSATLGNVFSAPAFVDVEAKPVDLKDPVKVELETFDHFKYSITIAKKAEGEDYDLKLAVAADLAKERTPGKDEKADAKAKLDKEFKDKQQKLDEKLKAEKKLEPWIFVVAKFTIEPLLKERKELMEKPKEAPAAAEKPAAKE
jgi:hypothetical protein